VESVIGREPESLLDDVYGGTILGGTIFIKEVLRRIKEDYYRKEDISNKKALMAISGIEEVAVMVADYYNLSRDELAKSKSSEQRKIAIYLMKERTGSTNGEIGSFFEGLSSSAVRKVYQRFKNDIKVKRKLRRHVMKIENNLSRVRG
jgi:chromosomal replication initiation ATPase DnaA